MTESIGTHRDLGRRVVTGSIRMLGGRAAQQAILLLRLLLVARLLEQAQVGLMGVTLLVLAIVEILTATGFLEALISKAERIGPYLQPAWSLIAARGAAVAALLAIGGPALAWLCGDAAAGPMVQVAALGIFFQSLSSPHFPKLWVDLKVGRVALCETIAVAIDFATAILLAYLWGSAWALVVGYLVGRFAFMVASYFAAPVMPKAELDFQKMKELYRYGRWVARSQLVVFGYSQADGLFVSHLLGTGPLAVHQITQRLSMTPVRQFTVGLGQVLFPAFSRVRDQPEVLQSLFLRGLAINCAVMMPVTFLMLVFSESITVTVLGARWANASPVMTGAALIVILSCVNAMCGGLLLALARPDLATKFQSIKLTVLLLTIVPLIWDSGVAGAIFASFAGELVVTGPLLAKICNLTSMTPSRLLRPIGLPLIAAGTAVWLAAAILHPFALDPVAKVAMACLIVVTLYAPLMLFVAPRLGLDLWREIDFIRGAIAARGNPTAPPRAEPPTSKADTSSD